MSDVLSGLPIRTQLPGQVAYDDVIVKLGDGTTPSQVAKVDTFGNQYTVIADASGNAVTTVANGGVQALEVQTQTAGPVTPGTAAAFSDLIGGQYNSSLPTLTTGQQSAIQLDSSGRILLAPLTTSSVIKVDLQDGSGNAITSTGGSLNVNLTNTPIAVTQSGSWTVTANQGTSPWVVSGTVTSNQGTSPWVVSGTVGVSNLPTTVDTNYGTVGANTIRTASQIGNATGAADFNNGATGAQTLRVAANLAVAGANVSATNPIPVTISAATLGTPVNDYNTAAAVASNATSNHDYSITSAKTFQGKMIWASASDLMRIEVQISPDGTAFSTKWVGFNSTATPNIFFNLDELVFVESGSGSKIRIIRTNLSKKSQDLYSTISGTEV